MVTAVPSYPHSCQCYTDQHSTCLVALVHLRLKPKPALTASTRHPSSLSSGLQTLSEESIAGRKDAAKHATPRERTMTPPGQLSAARCRNNYLSKSLHICKTRCCRSRKRGERCAHSTQVLATHSRQGPVGTVCQPSGEARAADASTPSLQTLLPLAAAAT